MKEKTCKDCAFKTSQSDSNCRGHAPSVLWNDIDMEAVTYWPTVFPSNPACFRFKPINHNATYDDNRY